MIHRLEFPYVNDDLKTLAENRRDFKDFFSCLTNIRCAVVEGGHRIEAACRTLHGYKLGAYIPLHYNAEVDVPASSTLFKPIPTNVYYSQNEGMVINKDVIKYFRDISSSIADDYELYLVHT